MWKKKILFFAFSGNDGGKLKKYCKNIIKIPSNETSIIQTVEILVGQTLCKIIEKRDGGLLIIDYGYLDLKIKNTIQAIKDHKFSNILEDIGDSDITYNLNFNLYANYINQFEKLDHLITNQKKFLTSMGILQRAEIVSNNIAFSQKTDLFYRIRRLIDEKQMGELFKVMLIKIKNNKFKTGFQID